MPQLNNADREQLSFYSTNIHRLNKSTLFPSFSLQKWLKWKIVSASESLMLIYSRGIYTALALEGSQVKSDEDQPLPVLKPTVTASLGPNNTRWDAILFPRC